MNTIAWIGFSQSLFASILMFNKKESSLSDKVLSGWLSLLAIDFMICGLDYEIFGLPLLSSSFLLFNPCLYLYINSLTRPQFKLRWIQLFHLLPFVFFEIYTYIITEPFSLDTFFLHDEYYLFRLAFTLSTILSWCIYIPLSLILVNRHRMNLKNEWSNIEKNESLSWLLAFAVFYVVFCMFAVIITVIAYFNHLNPLTPHIYNYSTLLLLVYIMSFYGLRQQVPSKRILSDEEQQTPYKNSTLTEETKQLIQQKILIYFETGNGYLNPDLNMNVLSEHLKIPKYQITEVLNTKIGMNFFQFVNHYRVEAVKKMLTDSNNKFSIEAIGYECGFSSKSSFYTVFKSMTGRTPVSYRNTIIL
jgi:AraC-like DNA-binding protein